MTQGAVLNKFTLDGKNAILGFDDYKAYVNAPSYMGEVVGPFANRIKAASFSMDGNEYLLDKNDGNNNLHSGSRNYGDELFEIAGLSSDSVTLALISKERAGFPGNHEVMVTYLLSEDGVLSIDYQVRSDKRCPVSVTNHAYFNLAGHDSGTILSQWLKLESDKFLPINEKSIPDGEVWHVRGLPPFDFRIPYQIGARISDRNARQLAFAKGYDHCYVINGLAGTLRLAATLLNESNGRVLRVETTEPAMQIYSGNWLTDAIGNVPGKNGATYGDHSGIAIETQHVPDAINQGQFRANILVPGRPYSSTTIYRPGVAE